MKLICINCDVEFDKPQDQKTCSRKCSSDLKKRNNREIRNCSYCEREFEVKKVLNKKLCSDECRKLWSLMPENKEHRIKRTFEAFKEKYGTENIFTLEEVKNKSKNTKFAKYGDENFINLDKNKKTKLDKYGDENYNNLDKARITKREKYGDENYNNREKAVETMNQLYGTDYAIQKEEFKIKQQNTNLRLYGVRHPIQNKEIKEKIKNTNIEIYGHEYPSQNEEVKNKIKETNLDLYKVTSLLKNKDVRDLGKITMKERYGFEYALQNFEIFQNCLKKQYRIHKYKDTNLYYQGSYEKYFLELLEEKELLSEVSKGHSFEYEWKGKNRVYHTDFTFREKQIEIKSGWTYDNNGKSDELRLWNETKWKAVRDSGEQFIVLIDKSEILGFVKAL